MGLSHNPCDRYRILEQVSSSPSGLCWPPLIFLSRSLDKELLESENSFFSRHVLGHPTVVGSSTLWNVPRKSPCQKFYESSLVISEELQEIFCDFNSGYFSRKHSGSMCLLFFSLSNPEIDHCPYLWISTHPLATSCKGKYPHQLEKRGEKIEIYF